MILPLTNHKIWRRELEYAAHPKSPGNRNEILIKNEIRYLTLICHTRITYITKRTEKNNYNSTNKERKFQSKNIQHLPLPNYRSETLTHYIHLKPTPSQSFNSHEFSKTSWRSSSIPWEHKSLELHFRQLFWKFPVLFVSFFFF